MIAAFHAGGDTDHGDFDIQQQVQSFSEDHTSLTPHQLVVSGTGAAELIYDAVDADHWGTAGRLPGGHSMLHRTRTLLTAAAVAAAGLTTPAAATMGVGGFTAPNILTPTAGSELLHGRSVQAAIDHTGTQRGRYRAAVLCLPDGAADVYEVGRRRYYFDPVGDSNYTYDVNVPGSLPPNSACTLTTDRVKGGLSASVSFRTVWDDTLPGVFAEPLTRTTVWPHPVDGSLTTTFALHVRHTGDVGFEVARSYRATPFLAEDLGPVPPGRYTFTWDGRRPDGAMVREDRYLITGLSFPDDAPDGSGSGSSRVVRVKIGPDELSTFDRVGERGSKHLDIYSLNTYSDSRHLRYALRFETLKASSLDYLLFSIDVSGLEKGYRVTRVRMPGGGYKTQLDLAHLFSDVGRPQVIRCRGLSLEREGRVLVVDIPRSCMDRGGRGSRTSVSVSDRHGHYDSIPNNTLWTKWVTYQTP